MEFGMLMNKDHNNSARNNHWVSASLENIRLDLIHHVFKAFEISVSVELICEKFIHDVREHIKVLLNHPDVAQKWVSEYGTASTEEDVDNVYDLFIVMKTTCA